MSMEKNRENRYAGIPRLEDYSASPTFGFVEESPSLNLPEYSQRWVELATHTEELIRSGQIRQEVHQLPVLDHTRLDSPQAYKAAMVCLVALTQAYVWCEGEDGIPEVLPRCLAVPLAAVADYLQVPPSMHSYGFGLINWKLTDPDGKVELDNLETLVQICGGSDESWFFCTATQVELDFAPALNSMIEAQKAVVDKDVHKMIKELQTIEGAVHKMKNSFSKMIDGCRPHVFYNVFRPFLAGWDAPAFKKKGLKGLIYEGVSEEPLSAVIDKDVHKMIKELQTIEGAVHKMKNSFSKMIDGCRPHVFYNVFRPFLAGTQEHAAQSSTLQCLDAALV
eukprot:XP_011676723.1 PREDICTED: indoleamine 2,3-dioxygenase 2 [Strongylocentrotus purpuratus]